MNILSIDPGSNGGAALFLGDYLEAVHRVKKTVKSKSGQSVFTPDDLSWFYNLKYGIDVLVIEEPFVHKPAKQSMNSHCITWGCWGQLIAAVNYKKLEVVRAKEWKGRSDLSSSKDASLELARELYPEFADELKFKACDGVAEAILIGVDYVNRTR